MEKTGRPRFRREQKVALWERWKRWKSGQLGPDHLNCFNKDLKIAQKACSNPLCASTAARVQTPGPTRTM